MIAVSEADRVAGTARASSPAGARRLRAAILERGGSLVHLQKPVGSESEHRAEQGEKERERERDAENEALSVLL